MTQNLAYYCKKFSSRSASNKIGLNVSPDAPNKPILLLSVIEMIATGQITRNQIELNAELIATFLKFWSHLEPVRKPDIGLPFYHLTSDRTILTHTLISQWFGDSDDLQPLLQVNAFAEVEDNLLKLGGKIYQPQELEDEQTVIVRDAAFRKIVISTYTALS